MNDSASSGSDPTAAVGALVDAELATPVAAPVRAVATAARERHGAAVLAVLFYGSCYRDGATEGALVDLYLIVDRYRRVHRRLWSTFANALLPPNVYYVETEHEGRKVRAKYAVVSLRQFARLTGAGTLNPYFWARFAQPTGLVWVRDGKVRRQVRAALVRAIVTSYRAARPLVRDPGDPLAVWRRAFRESYRTELRVEKPERARRIVARFDDRYRRLSELLERLPAPATSAAACARRWRLRRIQGKLLSVLRLIKAAFTFRGGAEYLAWKIERHSGVPLPLTPWQKRHPILAAVSLGWRLHRLRVIR